VNKPNFNYISRQIGRSLRKHSPEILQGIGIAGMITTVVLAVHATPKALELIHEDSRKNHNGDQDAYTKKEAVFSAWKCYIPAAAIGTVSIICLLSAGRASHRKNIALGAAYTLSESAFKEYRDKVKDTIGEKKEKAVQDEISKDHVCTNPVKNNEVIITGKGQTLCFDILSGRYFLSDIDKLRKAENELNRRMRDDMYITVNEFYSEIGLSEISIGNDIGWEINRGYINLIFRSQLTEDDTPCLVVGHSMPPVYFT
jgi:hypothetical protein